MATKEVYFGIWCNKCKHKDKLEAESPCWECLDEPSNEDSHRPQYYEENKDDDSK